MLVHTIQIVFHFRSVNRYTYTQMTFVLLNESLYLLLMIVDSIGGKRKPVGVKPSVVSVEKFRLDIITYLVYQVNFKEWLSANKVPNDAFLSEIIIMTEYVVNSLFGYVKRHSFLIVLPYQIAVLTGQLAIFRDDERYVPRHSRKPSASIIFDCSFLHYSQ